MGTATRWTADRVVDAIDTLTASVTNQRELDEMVAQVRAGLRKRHDDHSDGSEAADGRRLAPVQETAGRRVA